jgi:hypothetical protein
MLWAAVAVLGIVATATVAWGASQLATPGIGLSSEPPSVVSGLAPAAATTPAHPHGHAAPPRHSRRPAHTESHTTNQPPAASVTSVPIPPSAPAPVPAPAPAPSTPSAPAAAPPAPAPTTSPSQPSQPPLAPRHSQTALHRDDSGGGGGSGSRGSGGQRDD